MVAIANYPEGFAYGLSLRGVPLFQSNPGNIFWVGNGTTLTQRNSAGADGNPGTFQRPFATLQRALNLCQANTGDVVLVKPGHAEAIPNATTLLLNKAGVAVIGLGSGSARPTFTLNTAATANIPLTAANVSLQNLTFVANFADVASIFTATGTATPTDFSMEACEVRDTSSILNALTLITGNATANSMNGLRLVGNRIRSLGTTAATTLIKLSSATDRVQIGENWYVGAVLNNTAAILAHGANVVTNLEMYGNRVVRPNTDTATGAVLITTTSTTNSGMVRDNYVATADVAAALLVTAGSIYAMVQNYHIGDADASAIILPAAGAN